MAEEPRTTGTPWLRSRMGISALAGGAAVLALAVGGVLFFVLGGDDSESSALDFADPVQLTPAEREGYVAAAKAFPKLQGATGTEQLRNLLGPPDTFEIAFSPAAEAGKVVREETWYYYDLDSAFFFLDGAFLYALPVDEPASLTIINLRYDPLDFKETTTLDDVRRMLSDAKLLVQVDVPADYELDITLWAGEQIVVAFDAGGAIFSVETVPVAALE